MTVFRRHPLLKAIALSALLAVPIIFAGDAGLQELDRAEKVYRQEGPEAALPLFVTLADEFRAENDHHSLARATAYIGEIHWRLGNYGDAEARLDQALEQHRKNDDRLQEGKTLNILGLLHWDLGELGMAGAYFGQGSEIALEVGDRRLAGAILNNLSLVYDEQGKYLVSLDQYQQVLGLYKGQNFPRGEGDTLGNMGGVYLLLGRYRQALEHYGQALEISQQLDSVISLSQDHGNMALAYQGLGDMDLMLRHLDEAIALARSAGMQQDEAFWMRHKGNALVSMGRHDEGLNLHRAALESYDRMEGRTEKIEALHDMGGLYQSLGDLAGAESYFQQSMELAREVGVARAVTGNLLALGELQLVRGDFENASVLFRDAIERARESGEMAAWSRGLLLLSAALREQQKFAPAGEAAQQSLELAREIGAAALEARAKFELAELSRLQGEYDSASNAYQQCLALLDKTPDVELAWKAHYGYGLALSGLGKTDAAIRSLEDAVRIIEGVRNRLAQERFRAGYVQDKYQVYIDLVRLQLEAGRKEAAFSTAERLRSRSYLNLVESRWKSGGSSADDRLEFELKERIATLRQALAQEQSQAWPQQRQSAIEVYSRELLDAEQAYQAFLDERGSARPAHGPDRVLTYAEVGGSLAADEALLEYVVGQDRIILFLLTRNRLDTNVIPLRRQDLDNKVELLRNLISQRNDDRWKKPAASLSEFLLGPLNDGVAQNIRHLYLVPHGTLNYLPFALLPRESEERGRLIESFTLAYLPTAAALLDRQAGDTDSVGILAMAPQRSRLQHAPAEARTVGELFSTQSRALVGASATESVFKQQASRYRMLHLATHGYFNKLNPMLSGLELESDESNDGLLELHEILGMELEADLVTLSACQTALGSGHFAEIPAGDDFVGLTRAFLYAGSTSVMATLWEVDDASTLELMKRFYGGLAKAPAGEDMAAALALAQRALLSSTNYSHPYYWAPFVLVGETKRGDSKGT